MYFRINAVKIQLSIPLHDTSQDNLLYLLGDDADKIINSELRRKFGKLIVMPLTKDTVPNLDPELHKIADELVIAEFRRKISGEDFVETAYKNMSDALDRIYGWTRD